MKCMKQLSVVSAMTAVSLLAGMLTSASAQEGRDAAVEKTPVKKGPCVRFASDLIGMKVLNTKGEDIGKIEEVVIHPGGDVAYAVLSFGGTMGMGEKLFAIPWGVLQSKNQNLPDKEKDHLVLPMEKERLKGAPGFDKKNWPTFASTDWAKDVDTFYKSVRRAVESVGRDSPPVIWKCSELKGFNVQTPTGDKLGDVKEVAIDLDGHVNYLALSVGGFLGVGDKVVAVPWNALKVTREGEKGDKKKVTLATTKERLEQAPVFNKDVQAEMCDPAWIARVYEFYSVRPYWSQVDKD